MDHLCNNMVGDKEQSIVGATEGGELEIVPPKENAWSKLCGREQPETRRRKYRKPRRKSKPKPTAETEFRGTIIQYLTKNLNTQGMVEQNGMVGSKRKYGMVEDQIVTSGSKGALPKRLKIGMDDYTNDQGYAKSKTEKRRPKYALLGMGGNMKDIRTFWNKGEELPGDLEKFTSLI